MSPLRARFISIATALFATSSLSATHPEGGERKVDARAFEASDANRRGAHAVGDFVSFASTRGSSVESAPAGKCAPEPPIETSEARLPLSLAMVVGDRFGHFESASLGKPTRGSLFGGVELRDSDDIEHAGGYGWGTESVVRSIERAVREVRRCHPGSPRLFVGDISREHGGWLRPHASHQSGLDADIGYFYVVPALWYLRADAKNLDAERTWALIRAFVDGGNVDTIFVDASIQRLLKGYLAKLPESERRGLDLFESPLHRDATIRHAWGHATHFHVRFKDDGAVKRGEELRKATSLSSSPSRSY